VDVSWEVRNGRPDEEIVDAARASGADLIAMSTHGRSGLGRLLFGSVAEQVLRRAEVPVFLMRQTESRLRADGGEVRAPNAAS
jgi:nucleotide-binding universal stress UspA family protein